MLENENLDENGKIKSLNVGGQEEITEKKPFKLPIWLGIVFIILTIFFVSNYGTATNETWKTICSWGYIIGCILSIAYYPFRKWFNNRQ